MRGRTHTLSLGVMNPRAMREAPPRQAGERRSVVPAGSGRMQMKGASYTGGRSCSASTWQCFLFFQTAPRRRGVAACHAFLRELRVGRKRIPPGGKRKPQRPWMRTGTAHEQTGWLEEQLGLLLDESGVFEDGEDAAHSEDSHHL